MDKKLTADRIKQLEDNANMMKEGGYSDEDIQAMSTQFIDEYGVDDTTSVKKKDIPTQSTFGGSVSPTQDTRMGASATQSQPEGQGVNSQFNMMSFRNPVPETPIPHENKVAYAKKAYRSNPLVPQGISDEDLNTVIEKNVTKNPDAFNQLAHQVQRKEERDSHIANASVEDLIAQRNSELEHAQKTNTFYEYQQSRFGKAVNYLTALQDGENISEKDAEYLKSIAPTAYNELVPDGNLQAAININRANKQAQDAANATVFNEAKKAYLTQNNIIDATQIATMSDQVKVGEVSAKQNQQKEIEVKNLQLKYPLRQIGNTNFYNEMPTKMDFPPEYYAELKKVDEKYGAISNYLGSVHGAEFAKTQKDAIVSGSKSAYDIGIESLKVQNKNTHDQYISGGQKSQEVKAIATKLGIESMLATGDPEIVRKAQVEQTDFFKKYPKELADDTIKRLSVEYFKHKGISRLVNDVTVPTSELDKIAENLPQQNKDWYYANIATTRDPRKFLGATTSIGTLGLTETPTNKSYATNSVQLMNPGGSINSLLEGFINPFIATGKLIGDVAGARTKQEIVNENLSGQPILDQNPFNKDEANSKIKEVESKPKKSYQDLVELQQAKEIKEAIPFGADVINRVSSTVGMVGAIALQSNMLASAVGSIAGVSGEGLTAMQQGIQTETSAAEIAKYAAQLKNIGATTGQVAMAATMADDMYKNALRLMPNDNQATQRVAYTALLTTMWGAVSRIMPFEKVFKGLTPEAETELANLAKEVTQKSVTKEALQNSLGKIVDKYILLFAKGTATDLAKVTAEMTGAQIITQATDAVANPSEFNPEAAKDAVVHTLLSTPIDMLAVAGMGGIREVFKNPISISSLASLSNEEVGQKYIDVVQAQMQKGDITQKEATEKIQIVNTLQDISKKDMPEVDAIKKLTQKESDSYRILLLTERLLKEKMSKSEDKVLNKVYENQIAESEAKRQQILGQDFIVDSNYNIKSVEDANNEMSNTESIIANGTSEVQGESKTNNEVVTNNSETKNAEVGSGSEASGTVDATAETAPTEISSFADRMAKGEKMTSPEDLQFYENNKEEIENVLSEKAKSEPTPTNSNEPSSKVEITKNDWDAAFDKTKNKAGFGDLEKTTYLVSDGLEDGDKVMFFAEKERQGTWDANRKMVIDKSGNPWGLARIFSDKNAYIKKVEPIAEHQVTADEKFSPAQMSDALREEYNKQFPQDIGVEESNLQKMYDEGKVEFVPVNDKQGLYKLKEEDSAQWNKMGDMKNVTLDKAVESLKKDAETILESSQINKDVEKTIKEKELAIEQLKKEMEYKIRELKKNKIDVELPPLKKIANSDSPIENMERYESIQRRKSIIDDIIKCL